eukprot:TRINITY_DN1247_c0_g1_i1.p1 TRINITY_DN1247_c0_g1~~TRINITY_DN1247_c0_g1_i1.p1  ORF type:complete len:629 (-),score=156.45 TRINITY_DN1247_c0_g1_i1:47-1933(-)
MASKLDYLKKYLVKPGGSETTDVKASQPALDVAGVRKKKKRSDKGAGVSGVDSSLRIRDLSEALPSARSEKKRTAKDFLASELAGARPDEELVFVNKDEVEEAQKIDVEKSGVAWTISQHQKSKAKSVGFAKRAPPAGIKRESTSKIKEEEESDGDLSPPRAAAKPKQPKPTEADLSPPRGRPAAKQEKPVSDDDLSPPRAGGPAKKAAGAKADSEDDLSPPRQAPKASAKRRHDSDSDISPPRAPAQPSKESKPSAAEGKKGRARHDSDSDLSPPRASAQPSKETKPSDAEGKKGRARHDSDSDLSPPRAQGPAGKLAESSGGNGKTARTRHDSDSDLSPPRAAGPTQNAAPAEAAGKARTRHDSDSDLSPPRAAPKGADARKRHDSDSDLSPPRAGGKRKAAETEEVEKMSSGLRAGLVRGSDLKEEAAQVRQERRAAVEAQSDDVTGKGAATVYRNRDGKRIEREEWVEQQKKKKKKRAADYPEQELEWGGGLKQRDNQEAEKEELSRIAAQPFARFAPDEKYMQELRAKQDWNDPMRKFEEEQDTAPSLQNGGSAPSEGEKPQAVQKPKCPHAPWPNRYDIKPGYRWDGKVRGNGFEKKWFQTRNQREFDKADRWRKEMAYDDN